MANIPEPTREAQRDRSQAPKAQIREVPPSETRLTHEAMCALRPRYQIEEAYVAYVNEVLRPQGYGLLGAFLDGREQAVSAAGFRVGNSLAWRRYIYVDDISTVPEARRQGHAGALLDWLVHEGHRLGCMQLHLDSGTGPERFDAHRLYHNHGLAVYSYHFVRALE
jgi:GNAT superfamily N-acetyltransferase